MSTYEFDEETGGLIIRDVDGSEARFPRSIRAPEKRGEWTHVFLENGLVAQIIPKTVCSAWRAQEEKDGAFLENETTYLVLYSPVPFDYQNTLLAFLKKFHLPHDPAGQCNAFAHMGLFAGLCDDLDKFQARMEILEKIHPSLIEYDSTLSIETIKADILRKADEIAKQEPYTSLFGEEGHEIEKFLPAISISQNPDGEKFKDVFGGELHASGASVRSRLFWFVPKKIESTFSEALSNIGYYDQRELKTFFEICSNLAPPANIWDYCRIC